MSKRGVSNALRRLIPRSTVAAAATVAATVSAASVVRNVQRGRRVDQMDSTPSTGDLLPPADVELDSFDELEFVEEGTDFVSVELGEGGAPPVVMTSGLRFSRLFCSFLTLCVGAAAAAPVVVMSRRRRQDVEPVGDGGQVDGGGEPSTPADPIHVVPEVDGRKVSFCELHSYYFEPVNFCPLCERDALCGNIRQVRYDDVPVSWQLDGRLVPKVVFPPYLFDIHHYTLVCDVLVCSCGRHKARRFTSATKVADTIPFHTELRFLIETTKLVKIDAAVVGFPVYSSYGYLEGYSPSVV